MRRVRKKSTRVLQKFLIGYLRKSEKKLWAKIPQLIIHALDDPSVLFDEAKSLHKWNSNSVLLPIKNTNHVFDAKHPWEDNKLPQPLKKVVDKTIVFINEKRP